MTGVFGVPNPNPRLFAIQLSGPADSLEIRIYDVALKRVAKWNFTGPFGQGWVSLSLPGDGVVRWPNGLYYATAQAWRGGAVSRPVAPAKLAVLR